MFDYISISTNDINTKSRIASFCKENNINIEIIISTDGEILYPGTQIAKFNEIKIEFKNNGYIKLKFSVHKLYNNLLNITNNKGEPMNHDTFCITKMRYIIKWLEDNFQLNRTNTKIHHLEFGFNLTDLRIDTDTIINKFIAYRGRQFNKINKIGLGNGIEVSLYNYYKLKIYDKALQYGLPYPNLRIEFKALCIKPIKYNIFEGDTKLSRLLELNVWYKCKNYLLEQLTFCIISDTFNNKAVKAKTVTKLLYWNNPKFWETCKPDIRSKSKKEFENLINLEGTLMLKQKMNSNIENEFKNMIKNGNEFQ